MIRNITRYFSTGGLVFLAFGVISFIIDILLGKGTKLSLYPIANFIIGGLMLIVYVFFHASLLKRMMAERSSRYGLGAILYILLFVGVVAFANVILTVNPTFNRQFDFTENQVYSLSDQSQKIAKALTQDVSITGFYDVGAAERAQLQDLMERYSLYTPHIKTTITDADSNPALAEAEEVTNGVILVSAGKNKTKVSQISETEMTNALIQVASSEAKKIYFLEGHHEGDPADESESGYSILKKFIENEGYASVTLNLATMADVPLDCTLLLVVRPQDTISPEEQAKIDAYLAQGGHAIFLLDPVFNFDRTSLVQIGFEKLLEKWGIALGNDVIMHEEVLSIFGQVVGRQVNPRAIISAYENHPITQDYKRRSMFQYAQSLVAPPAVVPGLIVEDLIKTGDEATWGETDMSSIAKRAMVKDGSDHQGTLVLAKTITKSVDEGAPNKRSPEAKLIVFGDSTFVSNGFIPGTDHLDLLLNGVNWLSGEAEKISIRPKMIRASNIDWTPQQATQIFYLSVLILPQFVLLFGLIVWRRRKNQ